MSLKLITFLAIAFTLQGSILANNFDIPTDLKTKAKNTLTQYLEMLPQISSEDREILDFSPLNGTYRHLKVS